MQRRFLLGLLGGILISATGLWSAPPAGPPPVPVEQGPPFFKGAQESHDRKVAPPIEDDSLEARQFRAILAGPTDSNLDKRRRETSFRANRVPTDQQSREACLAGAKSYLKRRWTELDSTRLLLGQQDEPLNLTSARSVASEIQYLLRGARTLEIPASSFAVSNPKISALQTKLLSVLEEAPPENASDATDRVLRLALLLTEAEDWQRLLKWIARIKDGKARQAVYTDLTAVANDDGRLAILANAVDDSSLAQAAAEQGLIKTDAELVDLLKASKTDGVKVAVVTGLSESARRYPTLEKMPLDASLALPQRIAAATAFGRSGRNLRIAKQLLEKPITPEWTAIKTAYLKSLDSPGSHPVDADALRAAALNAKESMEVRTLATSRLSKGVNDMQSIQLGTGLLDEGTKLDTEALRKLASQPDLREAARAGLKAPEEALKTLKEQLARIQSAKAQEPPKVEKDLQPLIEAALKDAAYEEATTRLLIAFLEVKIYADSHHGNLPASLERLGQEKEAPLFFPSKNWDKSGDVLLAAVPELLEGSLLAITGFGEIVPIESESLESILGRDEKARVDGISPRKALTQRFHKKQP